MKLGLHFQKVNADRLFRWQTTTTCVRCARPVTLTRGDTQAILRADREFIGVICVECLTPESRAKLATLRAPQMQP